MCVYLYEEVYYKELVHMTMGANKSALGKPIILHPFSPQLLGSVSQASFLHTEAAAKGGHRAGLCPISCQAGVGKLKVRSSWHWGSGLSVVEMNYSGTSLLCQGSLTWNTLLGFVRKAGWKKNFFNLISLITSKGLNGKYLGLKCLLKL